MITHRTKIRQHLRSARVSALTPEERREELRAAEARRAAEHRRRKPAAVGTATAVSGEPPDSSPTQNAL